MGKYGDLIAEDLNPQNNLLKEIRHLRRRISRLERKTITDPSGAIQVYSILDSEGDEFMTEDGIIDINQHQLKGTFTDNSPSSGYVAWSGIEIGYQGTEYEIADGNTNLKYIYWLLSAPTVLQTVNAFPGITSDDVVVAINESGTHRIIMMIGGLVSNALIEDLAINAAKLADAAVETAKIKDLVVTVDKVAINAIIAAKLADNAVETAKIKDLNITVGKLADAAVETIKIKDLAVAATKLADAAVETAKIKDLNITTGKIAALAVTAAKIAADTITANEIAASAITATELATDSVITAKIQAGAVTAAKIAALTITANEIAAGAIIAAKIASLAVETDKLAANAVTAAKIAALTITANEIAANAITSAKIYAGAVTSDKISVAQLSAIIADMGLLTAGEIRLGTGTVGTNFTGLRITEQWIIGYLNEVAQFWLSAATGKAYFGGGAGWLDKDGITIAAGEDTANKFKFGDVAYEWANWITSSPNYAYWYRRVYGSATHPKGRMDLVAGYGSNLMTLILSGGTDGTFAEFIGGYTKIPKLVLGGGTTLTIASGVITVAYSNHLVDTEGGAATDDLDTINGGVNGMLLVLGMVDAARDITLKAGTGNINMAADVVLSLPRKKVALIYDGATALWNIFSEATA